MAKSKSNQKVTEKKSGSATPFTTKENPVIVAVGASAGGLQAIYSFFENIEVFDEGYCIVIMQHLSPDYKSLMPELLRRHTKMDVVPIEDNTLIEGGKVFVAQPNKTVTVEGKAFSTKDRAAGNVMHYPINTIFESIAESSFKHKVGVILSGSGSDGTLGIERLKENDAFVIVQDELTAAFNGMPKSAISTGVADRIVAPELIPETIVELLYFENKGTDSVIQTNLDGESIDSILKILLGMVNKQCDIDFSGYKLNTIHRRIERRLKKLKINDLTSYVDYIYNNPDEARVLSSEFLINVTSFFRDGEAFEYLKNIIIPKLFESTEKKEQLRVWCAGCATGQEAYSLAILLYEYANSNDFGTQIKVFATDAHHESLHYASRGLYSIEEVESVPQYYLGKYFTKKDDFNYQIKNHIRDLIVFAHHNLIKDPPFNNINLVTCRNLLIYLKGDLQQKVISFVHFSLVEGGVLFLGPSETPVLAESSFQPLNANYRLFKKLNDFKTNHVIGLYSSGKLADLGTNQAKKVGSREIATIKTKSPIDKIKDDILEDLMPPCVVVNGQGDVLHVFGEVEKILRFPKKQFHLNILKMIPDELYIPINTIIRSAKSDDKIASVGAVSFAVGNQIRFVSIAGRRVNANDYAKQEFIAITFTIKDSEKDDFEITPQVLDKEARSRTLMLEEELRETKEFLQNTVEELETSNEELQATNEELVASNEELQSTNEELQSVNEELYSVNAEFQSKVTELVIANDDLVNLLKSTEIGTLFLDRDLKIRRFTMPVKDLFNINDGDIGRPISDLNTKLDNLNLESAARDILKSLEIKEVQVQNAKGKYYLMRMVPYRSSEEKIEGVVISFINIQKLKQTEQILIEKTRTLSRINRELEQVAYVATHDLRAPVVNMDGLIDIHVKRNNFSENDEVIKRMRSNVKRIISTLDGLIEIASYQYDEEGSNNQIDLIEILEEVKVDLLDSYPKADISWDLEVVKVVGVKSYFRSIFQNLLQNAIKYARKGVATSVKVRSYRKMKNQVVIEVEDNGVGIPSKYYDSVFKAFKRLHVDDEGKGIGLYLVKSQIEAMNGTIRIESIENEGTKFIINL